MNHDRLKLLEQFVKEEPEDPFNWYVLALEETKSNTGRACELFEHVLENHPDYLPSYYHAADLYLSLGNVNRAKVILEKGLILARQKKEQKTMNELRTLLDELID